MDTFSGLKRSDDRAAIEVTVRDYIEGWRTGDAPRMEGALSPHLAKRHPAADGGIEHIDAASMIEWTAAGYGIKADGTVDSAVGPAGIADAPVGIAAAPAGIADAPAGRGTSGSQPVERLVVHAVHGDIASAELVSSDYIDYLQLAWNGCRWVIVNVLWAHRAKEAPAT